MKARHRATQAELAPVYVQPTFDARERAAKRAWCAAAYRGDRYRPGPGDFDPLWLRLGLRMSQIESRAGWVVSNPLLDQSLRRNPSGDPSLPGVAWLREVYGFRKHCDLVTLPGVRGVIERRLQALRRAQGLVDQAVAAPPRPQRELFGEVGA